MSLKIDHMSRSTTQSFTCPCGQVFSYQSYEYVNVATDPSLRYVVLAGLLNVAICPFCGRRAEMPIPFLYSDPAHHLLAYVHPNPDTPEEARFLILEQLRATYHHIVSTQDKDPTKNGGLAILLSADEARSLPSLKVLFGLDQLVDVINADLEPEERMGKLALNTQSRDEAERNQFLLITRKLATEMGCCLDVEDLPDEYTLWLYGSRRQIGALMRALAPRS
jgi:hypothetical protein